MDYDKQRRTLAAGVDVLIGTPGRTIDFFRQHVFDLRHVQVMVLDEADRMFDLGFIKDIRFLLRRLPAPEHRLNMLFSATLSHRVLELAYEHMNDPELIRIEPERITAERVRQVIYYPAMEEKAALLVHLLRKGAATRTLVFVNTKRLAERLERLLRANGVVASAMSGDVPQRKRMRMLREFHDGKLAALVATDVAARGLHIPDVSHVFNYDLPQDPEDYVHRIGRTARAGAAGDAVSFGCEQYVESLPDIEAFIGHRIPVGSFDPAELAGTAGPRTSRRAPSATRKRTARRPATSSDRRPPSGGGAAGSPARRRRRRRRRRRAALAFGRAARPSRQLQHRFHAREAVRRARRRAMHRPAHRVQPADAVVARGAEHRRVVVREQRARRIEGLARGEPRPEFRVLLGLAEIVRGIDGVEAAADAEVRILDREDLGMGVGDEGEPAARGPARGRGRRAHRAASRSRAASSASCAAMSSASARLQ